jgi:predicted ATPase/DNA-binding CsgD family transcriptional regulator
VSKVLRRDSVGLPGEVTSFVGRRQATAEVKRALSNSRLVTLTGVGGVGKSRLALHVANLLRRAFPDGVCLVELGRVHDPASVPSAVVGALGLLEHSTRDVETVLVDFLAGKRMLILLDNCEHVLDSAGRLAHTLLSSVPGLRVVATSREPLGIAAEHVWPVSPLSVPATTRPGADGSRRFEAVRLFEERAAAVLPGFSLSADNTEAVIRLCQRLDGVPLALELAAVRVRMLSVEQILSRLEHRFQLLTAGNRAALPRHQTLRAAVDWSYDLCTAHEKVLWARCSVFAGEFDLESVESVCADAGLDQEEIFSGIAGLVDKSVLTRQDRGPLVRYRMLETIRQYGAERLAEAGDQGRFARRQRDFFLRLARQADQESCGPRQREWMKRLRAERANLWAALEYCLSVPGEERTGLRLASALWFYWIGCGLLRDGRHWLSRALAANQEPSSERARALWLTGWIALLQGDTASVDLLTEARDMALRLGDETEFTYAVQFLGEAQLFVGNFEQSVPMSAEAMARHRRHDRWTASGLLVFAQVARVSWLAGRIDEALDLLDEGKALCTSLGERWTLSWTMWHLAVLYWELGQHKEALAELCESLRIKADLDDQLGVLFCVDILAAVAASDGDGKRAAVLDGAASVLWPAVGRPLCGFDTMLELRRQAIERARAQLGEQAYAAAERRGARFSPSELVAFALGEETASERSKPEPVSGNVLTRRESQVAELVAAGRSNREIAEALVISQRTVESHVDHILSKLGFTTRTQVAVWLAKGRSEEPG